MKTLMRISLIMLLIISVNNYKSRACLWMSNGDDMRISMFRAEIEALRGFRAFYYTPDKLNEYLPRQRSNDRYENCKEWNQILGGTCTIDDIFTMLYKTDKTQFGALWKNATKFIQDNQDNSFIAALSKNDMWQTYFIFAKLNEFYNILLMESWAGRFDKDLTKISKPIYQVATQLFEKSTDNRLTERTAFHLIRLNRLEGKNQKAIDLYDKYFKNNNSKSVIKDWATLYYAEALEAMGKEVKANFLYSKIFNSSEEKRIRTYQLFNFKLFDATLKLAKTNDEKATLWALKAIHTPGPALQYIKKVIHFNSRNNTIPLLIMREVNKLEDWIFTPEIVGSLPSLNTNKSKLIKAGDDYETIKKKNRVVDFAYLKELKSYLKKVSPMLGTKLKDYLLVARAHLAIIERNNKEALSLFKKVSHNAEKPLLVQKSTELALYYIYEDKIENKKVQDKLISTLQELEKLAKKEHFYYKYLYSITRIIKNKYIKENDIVKAGLFNGKSKLYEELYMFPTSSLDDNRNYYSYSKIAFYDKYADFKDIDQLINFISKKNKTKFENYLFKQDLPSNNALLDLKGTIALRTGNIKVAHDAFSKVNHDFWKKTYEFSTYLKRDPFLIPYSKLNRKKFYDFNKADVLKELLGYLKKAENDKKKAAECYIKIGTFFYNASYAGNSWMMLSYDRTSYPSTQPYTEKDLRPSQKNYEDSYYKCSVAVDYLNKADNVADNDEDKAAILFMKHACNVEINYWKYLKYKKYTQFKGENAVKMYEDYGDTKFVKKIVCSTIELYDKG